MKKQTNKGRFKKGQTAWNKGLPHTNKTKQKLRLAQSKRFSNPEERKKTSLGGQKYKVNSKFFDSFTVKSAYWLGFLWADGYISKINNNVALGLASKDYQHLEKFKKDIKAEINIQFNSSKNRYSKKGIFRLAFNDYFIHNKLKELGFETRNKMPNIPKKYFYDFLRGYIDGDGYIAINKQNQLLVGISCPHIDFLNSLNVACDNLGNVYKDSRSNCYYLIFKSKNALTICQRAYEHKSPKMDRKYEIFNTYCGFGNETKHQIKNIFNFFLEEDTLIFSLDLARITGWSLLYKADAFLHFYSGEFICYNKQPGSVTYKKLELFLIQLLTKFKVTNKTTNVLIIEDTFLGRNPLVFKSLNRLYGVAYHILKDYFTYYFLISPTQARKNINIPGNIKKELVLIEFNKLFNTKFSYKYNNQVDAIILALNYFNHIFDLEYLVK